MPASRDLLVRKGKEKGLYEERANRRLWYLKTTLFRREEAVVIWGVGLRPPFPVTTDVSLHVS